MIRSAVRKTRVVTEIRSYDNDGIMSLSRIPSILVVSYTRSGLSFFQLRKAFYLE